MIVTDIETILLKSNYNGNYEAPVASYVSDGFIILKVYTDEGIIGIGEPSAYGGDLNEIKRVIEKIIKPIFLSKNPFNVNLLTKQEICSDDVGYGNVPYNCAIAGMSQALWDIIGKGLDRPVYTLLNKNGYYKEKVRVYASGGMWYEDQDFNYLIDEVLKLKEMGYTAWKFRPGTPRKKMTHFERNLNPPPIDIPTFISVIEKIRLSVGDDFDLMVDAGCRFNKFEDAVTVAMAMGDLNYYFFEEPLPRFVSDYKKLNSMVNIPVAGGESLITRHQFHQWIFDKALDIVQPDGNFAGITEVMSIAEITAKLDIPCIIHNWGNDISNTANTHLAAAIPNCPILEYNVTHNPLRSELVENNPFVPVNGYIELSQKPGLGIEVSDAVIRRFAF